ncbi:MAG: hypothetical protein N838_03375 [Thiohalocapsa sp. PB-PSB1]|nr:MAG: hypothetical protein N838_21055 [Thiohalocapsa sp. PB-PSB1]QQO52550.1 MAG: hypothetical protein N838_03375 [Thiohalocapsa sp. PB-PSB1]
MTLVGLLGVVVHDSGEVILGRRGEERIDLLMQRDRLAFARFAPPSRN